MKTPSNFPLQVFIHTPNDDIISINNIDANAKINDLKSHIEIKTGILAEVQNLYLSNIKLEDSKTFSEKSIKNGAVMRIRIKEKSLEQIYLNAAKGDVKAVFMLGVEFMKDDETLTGYEEEQMQAWNKFVPLRAFQGLFAACFKGHLQLVAELINRSAAHVRMISKNGRTLLHVAASQGHLGCVSFLLGQGVDAKLTDREGMSALAFAAENGHIKCEKRIWLFNWNMDVLKEMELSKSKSEDEKDKDSLYSTAERYNQQCEREMSAKNSVKFPPIKLQQVDDKPNVYHKIQQVNYLPQVRAPEMKSKERKKTYAELPENNNKLIKHIYIGDKIKPAPKTAGQAADKRVSNWVDNIRAPSKCSDGHTGRSETRSRSKSSNKTIVCGKESGQEENILCAGDMAQNSPEQCKNLNHDGDELNAMSSLKKREVKDADIKKVLPITVVNSIDFQNDDNTKKKIIKTNRIKIENNDNSQNRRVFIHSEQLSKTTPLRNAAVINEISKANSPHDVPVEHTHHQNTESDIKSFPKIEEEKKEEIKKERDLEEKEEKKANDVWRPESSLSFATTDMILYYGRTRKSYEDWLDEKRRQKKEATPRSSTSCLDDTDGMKVERNRKAFEKWLFIKARRRTRSYSEEEEKRKKRKHNRSLSERASTFEEWLASKKDIRPESEFATDIPPKIRTREKIKRGMTFEEWKKWKNEKYKNDKKCTSSDVPNQSQSTGLSFEKWLQAKEEERAFAMSIMKTKYAQEMSIFEEKLRYKMNDPRQKTYEEWFLEKKYDYKLEKKYNRVNKSKDERVKHPEDSNLIFDMWLADKYMREMEIEKGKLKETRTGRKSKNKSLTSITEYSDGDQYSSDDSSMSDTTSD